MSTPVKNPNDKLESRVERLKAKALRTRKKLLLAAKVEKGKAKTYTNLAKIQKLRDKQLATDTATKTAKDNMDDKPDFITDTVAPQVSADNKTITTQRTAPTEAQYLKAQKPDFVTQRTAPTEAQYNAKKYLKSNLKLSKR